MELLRQDALNNIIIRTTLNGALQRGRVYKSGLSDKEKADFRKNLAKELGLVMNKIRLKKNYSDSDHYKIIERFAKQVSDKYGNVLHH